jgi:hypothetical protein
MEGRDSGRGWSRKDEVNDEDDGPQQEVNDVVVAVGVGETHLSDEEDGRLRSAERQRLLSSHDPSPEPSHDEARSSSDGDNDDELTMAKKPTR